MSSSVIQRYRKILKLIHRLPKESQKEQALQQARLEMRKGRSASDDVALSLLQELDDKIRYLRIVTPKKPGDEDDLSGSTVYVFREGRLVEGRGRRAGPRVADGKMSMNEAYEKHQSLLKRQHFGRTPPKYDPSTF